MTGITVTPPPGRERPVESAEELPNEQHHCCGANLVLLKYPNAIDSSLPDKGKFCIHCDTWVDTETGDKLRKFLNKPRPPKREKKKQ